MKKLQYGNHPTDGNGSHTIVRQAIDEAISSLGGPIHKTITWHMNNRGVFADPKKIDIKFFYDNLKELLGPGADMIVEDVWKMLRKNRKGNFDYGIGTPVDLITRLMSSEEVD